MLCDTGAGGGTADTLPVQYCGNVTAVSNWKTAHLLFSDSFSGCELCAIRRRQSKIPVFSSDLREFEVERTDSKNIVGFSFSFGLGVNKALCC